jgi:hypothetical protein
MPIRSIADLRRQAGKEWDEYSDEDLISSYAQAANLDPLEVANTLGYRAESAGAGVTGQRFRSAADRYQAGLYGLGEEIAGGLGFQGAQEALAARRRANEFEAQVAAGRAREQGAVESFRDIQGIGDVPSYVTGLAIGSSPYIAEALVGGLAARGAMSGTRAALGRAVEAGDVAAEQAARASLGRGSLVGAGAISYPSSVGEVLQAQREQTGGETDLLSAAGLGVPYAALNVVGIEGALARGELARSGVRALDELTGVRGGAARAAVSGLKTGAAESASEVGQEAVSQLGRMAVDPNEQFLSPEARERYLESAVGGLALGGVFGAGAGGWRRSQQYDVLKGRADGQADAQNQQTLQLGYSPLAGTPIVFPDGTVTLSSDQELQARYGVTPAAVAAATQQIQAPVIQAAAAQQATQQAASVQQAAQISDEEYLSTAQRYGLTSAADRANSWDIAGKRIYGQPSVQAFVTALAQADREKSDVQKALESSVIAAGLVRVPDSATPKSLISAVQRQVAKFQIGDADTVDEAATRLNDQIQRLAEQGKGPDDRTVDGLARAYEALTGQAAPAFAATQISVPPTLTGERSGLITGQGQGAQAARPTAALAAPTPAPTAQPVSVAERGGTTQAVRAAAPAPTEVTPGKTAWEDMDVSGVTYEMLSPEDRAAWDAAVANNTATGETQEQLANEYRLAAEEGFAQQVLDRVLARVIKSPNKARYFANFLTVQDRGEPNSSLAAEYGVALETIKDWNSQLRTFLEDKGAQLREAFQVVAVELRIEPTQLQSLLRDMNARSQEAAQALQETTQPDEVTLDTREVVSEDGGMTEQTRKGASVQEVFNASETINARYLRLLQQLQEAENEGNTELVDALNAQLSTLGEQATKQAGRQTIRRAEGRAPARATKAQTGKKGESRAVQVKSTTAVSVQPGARGGQEVGQEVRRAERPAGEGQGKTEGQDQRQEVALTTAETAEATWNELLASLPQEIREQIPSWNALTPAQKQQVATYGVDLNMRNVEQVIALQDETRTIDVEAREISNGERKLIENGVKRLPSPQVAVLEKHYGAKSGTEEFVTKLATDIANYVNKGAEAVAAAIRGIIKSMAEGMVAFGLVFNPAVQYGGFNYDIQGIYNEARDQKLQVPADAKAKMSPLAQAVYRDMAATAKKTGKGFIIADKQAGMIHAFNADGSLLVQDNALFGKDIGDKVAKSSFKGGPKITPAGKFTLEAYADASYEGGYVLGMRETFDTTEKSWVAIHAAYLGNTNEKRLERLASPDAKDKRVSYGCINTTHEAFLSKFKPNISKFDGGMVFVLPEEAANIAAVKEGKTVFQAQKVRFNTIKGEAGIDNAMNSLRDNGVADVIQGVDQFELIPETSDSDGTYHIDENGRVVVGYKLSVLTEGTNYTSHVVRHELGHVADMANEGGIYSSHPDLETDGRVAKELFDLYNTRSDWNMFLSYPFEANFSPQRTQAELFAQLWSAYTDPVTRQALFNGAPEATLFMQEVMNHAKARDFKARGPAAANAQAKLFAVRLQNRRSKEGKRVPRRTPAAQEKIVVFSAQPARSREYLNGLSRGAVERNISKFPRKVQGPMRSVFVALDNWKRKGLDYIAFTPVIIDRAAKEGIASALKYGRLLQERGSVASRLEREVEGVADMYALVPDNERGIGDNSVNAYIYESTRSDKWGFQPSWLEEKVAIDSESKKAFDKFSPEAQAFITAVFKHGGDMLALKKKTVLEYTNSEYDGLIQDAVTAGDTDEAAKLRKQKADDLKRFDTLFKLREGKPYAPIKRTGNYVVVAKSNEYRKAEEENDTKRLRELEKDADHYHVSFVNGEVEAQRLQEQLLEQGHFGDAADSVDYFQREDEQARSQLFGGNSLLLAMTKLRAQVDSLAGTADTGEAKATAARMRQLVSNMYLEALAENSARKSELRRRGVAGEVDMLNSFTLQGYADANFLSAVQYNGQIQETIQAMRKEARTGGNRNRKSELMNELMKRYAQTLEFEPAPLTQKITRLTSIWFLATSPGYYLQNLTQPYMMSLPLMAARHDLGRSTAALYKAYTDLKEVMKSAKLFDQQFDFSKVPADVRDAIEELVVRSRIDIGLSTELGQFKIEGDGFFTDRWNKIDKGLRLTVQKVESVNRLSTAIAAYRLELERTGSKEKALEYADQILTDTHGDYTAFAAPRAFNTNLGKIALQFRKFQLIQLSLMAKLLNEAFTGKDRAVARKALAYILANTGLMAGVVGMPGYAAISWALGALFGDEDEPFNLEKTLRDYIGDETTANLILRGAPTIVGADLSGKIGMGNMLSVLPFTEIDKLDGAKTYEIIGTLLGGPAGGLLARSADAMGYIGNGDYWKGLETALPKGLADAMKAIRISGEGVTNRRGDVLLTPEETGDLDTFWRSIGIAPVKQTVRSFKQSAKVEMEQNFESRTASIKRDYVRAYGDRDLTKQADARRAWLELQEAKRRNGFKTQPLSDLLRTPSEKRERERMTAGGVQYDRGSRQFVERLI